MKILLTNDDGIYAAGIRKLAKILKQKGHRVAVVSPDRQRSASGHSITLHNPLRVEEVNLDQLEQIPCYRVSGTPVDCVKLGIKELLEFSPEVVISGINDAANLGYDVLYSGTVSAAVEGWLMGYDSLAVSLYKKNDQTRASYSKVARYVSDFLETEFSTFVNDDTCLLNINIPNTISENDLKFKVTSLTECLYDDYYESRIDPLGNRYYWLAGEIKGECKKGTDLWALENNFISITPLKLSLTDQQMVDRKNDSC